MPRAKVTRGQRSLLPRGAAGLAGGPAKAGAGGRRAPTGQAPVAPHKLSLLEVVLAPSSVSREQRRRSQFSEVPPSAPSIQGWVEIWSREGRSEGRRDRHH